MPRPIQFEIHAADFGRVAAFYEGLFAWTFIPALEDYWSIRTGPSDQPGIDGGLVRRRGPNPDPNDPTPVVGFICTHEVDDIEVALDTAMRLGGALALPTMAIPGVGLLAYIKDTEANILGLLQRERDD